MSVNKVILVGNLTKDPNQTYTPSGVAVCTFGLATNERYKNREGEQQERVEFHNIVCWRNLAEICGKYLKKGKQVYIEGKIQTRSYDDRDGNKKYMTEIVADQMQMLGSKGGDQQQQQNSGHSQQQGSEGGDLQQQNNQQGGYQQQGGFDPNDSIPF